MYLFELVDHVLQAWDLVDEIVVFITEVLEQRSADVAIGSDGTGILFFPSPYPKRFGKVRDIAGTKVTSIKAIKIAR